MALTLAVLVKEVPDADARRRIDPATGRLDRSGETALNPPDAHAIEAAVRLREGGELDVGEIVAICMGPEGAARTLQRAVSLGADRSVHLCDEALAGSDVLASAHALATVLSAEAPDLILLGQGSEDAESYVLGPAVAERLGLAAVTQVSALAVRDGGLELERQGEYGYDTLWVPLPALITVADALNEPRYPLLKAIMAARRKPLQRLDIAAAGIDPSRVGTAGARVRCGDFHPPATRAGGEILSGADPETAVAEIVDWLAARRLI